MPESIFSANLKILIEKGIWQSWVHSKRIVYLHLSFHQPPGPGSILTYSALEKETGIGERQLRRVLDELITDGFVNEIQRWYNGKAYQITDVNLLQVTGAPGMTGHAGPIGEETKETGHPCPVSTEWVDTHVHSVPTDRTSMSDQSQETPIYIGSETPEPLIEGGSEDQTLRDSEAGEERGPLHRASGLVHRGHNTLSSITRLRGSIPLEKTFLYKKPYKEMFSKSGTRDAQKQYSSDTQEQNSSDKAFAQETVKETVKFTRKEIRAHPVYLMYVSNRTDLNMMNKLRKFYESVVEKADPNDPLNGLSEDEFMTVMAFNDIELLNQGIQP
jgi:hypothetical protein